MRNRQQEYALSAFEKITARAYSEKKDRDSYGSMAHKFPVLIRSAGLAQAMAFVNSRGKDTHKALVADIASTAGLNAETLEDKSRKVNLLEYTRLTRQILDVCLWYKRYAESVLDVSSAATEGDDL